MMKPAWKYVVVSLTAVILAVGFAFAYIEGQKVRRSVVCEGMEIVIRDSSLNRFLSQKEVAAYMEREYGVCKGERMDSIGLSEMEEILKRKSIVAGSEAYMTKDGCLHIEVVQKRPAVRFQNGNTGYYADREGNAFPLQRNFSSYVPIIDGNIPLQNDADGIRALTSFMMRLEDSPQWSGRIAHINIDGKGNLTLYPKEGKEKFLFGRMTDIDGKLDRMDLYYRSILPCKGPYRTIDLKYDDQIVCK